MTNWNMAKKNYTKKGRKNKTKNPFFIKLCKMSQYELKAYLNKELQKYYKNVVSRDGFLYAKGKDKVLLTAHMDTVHKNLVKDFYEFKENNRTIISSPQGIGGDDRCGVYMILQILRNTKLRPSILFCEDEEIGLIGSEKFTKSNFIKDLEKMYFLVELDRKGKDEAVYYEDNNADFEDFIDNTIEYRFDYGSCSDISNLSPACGISSVNLSCGYYNQHTLDEYVVLEEMEDTIKATIKLIEVGIEKKVKFTYTEKVRDYSNIYGYIGRNQYGGYSFNNYYDNYDSYFRNKYGYGVYEESTPKRNDDDLYTLWAQFTTVEGRKAEDCAQGYSIDEVWGIFFQNNPDVRFNDIDDYDIWDADSYRASTTGSENAMM